MRFSHKQNKRLKALCIFAKNLELEGRCVMGRHVGGDADVEEEGTVFLSFLLSLKKYCIASAHSDASTPRLIIILGWNG